MTRGDRFWFERSLFSLFCLLSSLSTSLSLSPPLVFLSLSPSLSLAPSRLSFSLSLSLPPSRPRGKLPHQVRLDHLDPVAVFGVVVGGGGGGGGENV